MSHADEADRLLIKPAAGARPAPPRTRGQFIPKARTRRQSPDESHAARRQPGWQLPQTDQPCESYRHPTVSGHILWEWLISGGSEQPALEIRVGGHIWEIAKWLNGSTVAWARDSEPLRSCYPTSAPGHPELQGKAVRHANSSSTAFRVRPTEGSTSTRRVRAARASAHLRASAVTRSSTHATAQSPTNASIAGNFADGSNGIGGNSTKGNCGRPKWRPRCTFASPSQALAHTSANWSASSRSPLGSSGTGSTRLRCPSGAVAEAPRPRPENRQRRLGQRAGT